MRTKLKRFAENANRANILEPGKTLYEEVKGNWSDFFKNENDLVVELGCGKGEYSVGLAEHFPNQNFIGVDIKGERIWVGSTQAIDMDLHNVAFLRTQILLLEKFFVPNEVGEIWITFPDPRPKDRDIKRRLTSPRFMKMYKSILKNDGWVKFKTDSTSLFEYTLEIIKDGTLDVKDLSYTFDLYDSEFQDEHFGIKTKYEKIFSDKGEKIKYMKFRFNYDQT